MAYKYKKRGRVGIEGCGEARRRPTLAGESELERAMSDIRFEDRGTAVLIYALTKRGRAWIARHAEYEREAEGAVVVGREAARDIAREAHDDGLSVRFEEGP